MKVNILAITAHPDDAELSCAGTLIAHHKMGYTTGVLDLTRGEMGTRGTPEQRKQEAEAAARIMNLAVRDNLEFKDSFFENDREHQLRVIEKIRLYQPDIVITNALYDRHPDHGRGARLVEESVFKSGLKMVETRGPEGDLQAPWRPRQLYFAIQSTSLEPDFFVDVSEAQEQKMEAVRAYRSQFYDPNSQEPATYISKPEFMEMIEARAREYGQRIGVRFAEGFITKQAMGIRDFSHLI